MYSDAGAAIQQLRFMAICNGRRDSAAPAVDAAVFAPAWYPRQPMRLA